VVERGVFGEDFDEDEDTHAREIALVNISPDLIDAVVLLLSVIVQPE